MLYAIKYGGTIYSADTKDFDGSHKRAEDKLVRELEARHGPFVELGEEVPGGWLRMIVRTSKDVIAILRQDGFVHVHFTEGD